MKKEKREIIIFTDGSCVNNGTKNSYGGIGIHFPNKELKDISKVFKYDKCTNQKAELYAILTAIRYVKKNFGLENISIIIYTDSEYSIKCITQWVIGWKKNGWKTKNKTPVQNREFIEVLHKYYKLYDITLEHVDAHTNGTDWLSLCNESADQLAVLASKKAEKLKFRSDSKSSQTKIYSNSNSRSSESSKKSSEYQSNSRSGKSLSKKNYSNRFPFGFNFEVELVKMK